MRNFRIALFWLYITLVLSSVIYVEARWGSTKMGMVYWHINETGKRVLTDENYVPWTIRMAQGEKGPFLE